jgi:hypothetical protein
MVVSSDSMKKATATSQGKIRFTATPVGEGGASTTLELTGFIVLSPSIAGRSAVAKTKFQVQA